MAGGGFYYVWRLGMSINHDYYREYDHDLSINYDNCYKQQYIDKLQVGQGIIVSIKNDDEPIPDQTLLVSCP